MRRPEKPAQDDNTLLGDLESIRQLLASSGSGGARESGTEPDDTAEVPMLEDVVEGALRVDETPLTGMEGFAGEESAPSALADDAIEALLGDDWRAAAERIIQGARDAMARASARWTDVESHALRETLHARVDGALNDWMAEITLNHLDELRDRLLDALEDEVARITEQLSRDDREAGDHGE